MKPSTGGKDPKLFPYCSVKHCDMLAESIKRFGLELCVHHQNTIDKWLIEKGYSRELK